MSITLFGLVWLIIIAIAFFFGKTKNMIALTFLSMVFQASSVIVISETGVGPQLITSSLMIVWSFTRYRSFANVNYKTQQTKFERASRMCVLLLILAIIVSYLKNSKLYTINSSVYWLLFIQLLIYVGCFLCCFNVGKSVSATDIRKIIIGTITFVSIVGLVQFLLTVNILPKNSFIELLLYTKDTDSAYYWYDYYPRVFSTFMEPSYCGAFLVGGFYYIISINKNNNYEKILSVVVLSEIILTRSSTAYGSFVICGAIYLVICKNKKALRYLIPLGIIAVITLLITGQLKVLLDEVIFNKMQTGSGHTRNEWDKNALNSFYSSFLFGTGYKNVRGSQFLLSLLGQLGFIGCIIWFLTWLPMIIFSLKKRNNLNLVASGLFLVGVVVAMFIAIPDIDFCVFWGAMYMFAIVISSTVRFKYKENTVNKKPEQSSILRISEI